jgi:hypothetical protein
MSNAAQSAGHTVTRITPADGDGGYTIVIRAAWFEECRAAGLNTETDIAQAFNVSRATIARIHSGGRVGAPVIATALGTLGAGKFNRLFKVAA